MRNPDWYNFYRSSFLKGVHELIAFGYEDARVRIKNTSQEEEITIFIADAIKNRLDDPKISQKFRRYDVRIDDPVRNSAIRTGKRCQLIDIVIVTSMRMPRMEFMFEAKLLRSSGFPINRYTGTEGMECYINCEYASEYPIAGMLGYIQSEDHNRWYKELKRKFDEDMKEIEKKLSIEDHLQPYAVIPNLTYEWISKHKRSNNSTIDIIHIFLDCCL